MKHSKFGQSQKHDCGFMLWCYTAAYERLRKLFQSASDADGDLWCAYVMIWCSAPYKMTCSFGKSNFQHACEQSSAKFFLAVYNVGVKGNVCKQTAQKSVEEKVNVEPCHGCQPKPQEPVKRYIYLPYESAHHFNRWSGMPPNSI